MPSQAYLTWKERTYDGVGSTDKTISKPEGGQDNQIPPIPCRRVFHVPDNINHRVLSLDAFLQPGLPRAKNGLLFILYYAIFILHTGSRDAGNTHQLRHAAKTTNLHPFSQMTSNESQTLTSGRCSLKLVSQARLSLGEGKSGQIHVWFLYCILSSRAPDEVGMNINWDAFWSSVKLRSLNNMPKPRAPAPGPEREYVIIIMSPSLVHAWGAGPTCRSTSTLLIFF